MDVYTYYLIFGLIGLIIAFVIVIFILYMRYIDERQANQALNGDFNAYEVKQYFQSWSERHLFENLLSLPVFNNLYLFPQVPLSSFMKTKDETTDLKGKFEWLNSLRADYVVFDKKFSKPLLMIELNDESHNRDNRKARDQFLESAMNRNGIPFLIIPIDRVDDRKWIESELQGKLATVTDSDETVQLH